jgi:DnaJ-class molecular chaperone
VRDFVYLNAQRVLVTKCTSDPWRTLGVAVDADEQEIKKAYRKLALK